MVNLSNILPINIVGTVSGTAAAGTPTSVFSLAAIQDVVIVNENPINVNVVGVNGVITVGNIGAASGALTVVGGITSASASSASSTTTVSVVIPDRGNTNYTVFISIGSLGTVGLDNDLSVPVVRSLSNTGFDIVLEEPSAVTQNITLHLLIMSY